MLDLVKELKVVLVAGKQFDSKAACQAVEELIELIIEAMLKMSQRYSGSKIGDTSFFLTDELRT